jgi:Dyp-type peroxidase family
MPPAETLTDVTPAPAPPQPVVDWSDVQGEIFQPYTDDHSAHLFLEFPDAGSGAKFLAALKPSLSTAADWQAPVTSHRNLGISFSGLFSLGLPDSELASFPYPFRRSMAGRAAVLGDTGASAPDKWQAPYGQPSVHAWVLVSAVGADACDAAIADVTAIAKASGVTLLYTEKAANIPGPGNQTKEHFGFNDGIGQPAVAGAPGPSWPGQGTPGPDGTWIPLALGGFLLGYPNELGDAIPHPANPVLRQNSSYMVYRKLEQHVGLFRQYIDSQQHLLGGDGELLAAKMVGRWRSGAPLALTPDKDDPALGADDKRNDDFRYGDDADGMKVPHLAHIRRANPRDGLPKDNVVQPRLHRIIRRKMPYGPYLPEGAPDDGVSRGVIFRVYNADIVSQFEMVQSMWMSSANTSGGLSTDQDVIAGLTDPPDSGDSRLGSTFPIPRPEGIKTLYGLPRFVTLKGGEYFFVPGLKALDWLVDNAGKGDGQ